MAQRAKPAYPSALNLEQQACEKFIAKLMRDKINLPTSKIGGASLTTQKYKERVIKQPPITSAQSQLGKIRPNVKQQNLSALNTDESESGTDFQFGEEEESALVQVTVKTGNPRQRSKSTVANREPWGQLLKQQKSNEKVSIFNNFDPLRTLHFLAKELQYQLQVILPDDSTLQQMVIDMQSALKRVPPEIASAIHLQQAIELLPPRKSAKSLHDEKPEKLTTGVAEKIVQTLPTSEKQECERLQKIMIDSTLKLEASCKQMENLCEQLKNEKINLEKQLESEKNNLIFLKKKIEELELEKNKRLYPRIKELEDDKRNLKNNLDELKAQVITQSTEPSTEMKNFIADLKNSKAIVDHECAKLKHQLKLAAIEKEKYIAVLAVRDRQINEIRNEMTQLQEVVNEQLMELHNSAFQKMPSNHNLGVNMVPPWNMEQNKGDTYEATLSTIHSNDEAMQRSISSRNSFRDLPGGDKCNTSKLFQEVADNCYEMNVAQSAKHPKSAESHPYLDCHDSQVSIRSMFHELKKAAYAVGGTSQKPSQHAIIDN